MKGHDARGLLRQMYYSCVKDDSDSPTELEPPGPELNRKYQIHILAVGPAAPLNALCVVLWCRCDERSGLLLLGQKGEVKTRWCRVHTQRGAETFTSSFDLIGG